MVDYTIATQVRPMPMPDIGAIYGQAQNIQLNRLRAAELQAMSEERNALRTLAREGVDLYSPEGMARLRRVAPSVAPEIERAGIAMTRERRAGERDVRAAERDAAEAAAARLRIARDQLPSVTNQQQYNAWRTATVTAMPGLAAMIPEQFDPENVRRMMLTADDALRQHYVSQEGDGQRRVIAIDPVTRQATTVPGSELAASERPTALAGPGGTPLLVSPRAGTFRVATEAGAPPAAAPTAPPAAASMAPAAGRAPISQTTDPLAIDMAIRRAEGTGRNPRSSAQGPYQMIDSTFVDEFRRNFPDAARNLSPEQILGFRGATLPNGRRVEDVLGPAHTQRNIETLTQAGVPPVGANVYLAHHFGAQGALGILRADPNTPVAQLVTPQVIQANPFLRGLTAGQVIQWARNAMDLGPGEAQRRLAPAPAAAAPAAQPSNMMVGPGAGPRNAMTGAAPSTLAALQEADLRRRIALAGGEAGAGETARLQARTAETQRREATQLDQAIAEIERISRPGGLLERSTGSGVGRLLDIAGEFVGVSSRGAQAAAALAPIADVVLKLVPRFEGPQSDRDTKSYQEAAGRLADPTVPNETRLAAAREIVRLMRARRDQFRFNQSGAAAAPTGQTQAPTAFREGQTATGPNGQRIVFRNGQWMPMQ